MKKRSKIGRKIAADRISDLPESIIHDRIMSRLSRRDRARTRVLSKTWYLLNKTYPALDLDFDCFFQKENSDSPDYKKSLKSFTKRAYKSLLRFSRKKLRLRSLRINISAGLDHNSVLDRWIELGLESRIEKLKLYCSPFMIQNYSLPRPVNFSTTLTSLKLEHCVLDQPLSLFTSLRKLILLNCQLNDGQLVLENSDCPALESLTLWYCLGFDTVRISNLVQLHRVVLEFNDPLAVEIASQSVQKLVIVDFSNQCPWSEGISIYGCCSCLTFLHLNSDTIADEELHHLLAQLPLLEELSVFGCCQLKAMQVSSPRLKTLVVAPNYLSGLTSIDIEVPTLKNLMFISDISRTEKTEIKVQEEDCLETLVLCSADMRDKQFNKLITKFAALQNLWIYGCYELQKIQIPNRQLRRLHVARCSRLKDVWVGSCELVEMYCRGCEDLKVSGPDIDRMFATGGLRYDLMADCKSPFWSDRLHEMLMSLVQEKSLAELIVRNCCDF